VNESSKSEDVLKEITDLLEGGLQTQTEPFPQTDKEFSTILAQLRELNGHDLKRKLIIAGFTNKPHGPEQQRCMECMYFLVHRKWCDLPELALPVEAEWWCRLFRL
jgi:hypothetical protein